MKRMIKVILVAAVVLAAFFGWRQRARTYHHILEPSQSGLFSDISEIKIGTYNIKTLNGGKNLQEAVDDIRSANLDVICFEEVDKKAWRSEGLDMIKEIADGAGYPYYYFYQTMFLGIGYYGLGIISRYPLMETASEPLQTSLFREPRILAYAKIDVGEKPLNLYFTHLSFRPFEDKYQQMDMLQERFKNCERTVLMGDFNIFGDADFFEIEGMQACNQAENKYITFMDFGFPDNIFYSEDLLMDDITVRPTSFSDHHLFCGHLYLE